MKQELKAREPDLHILLDKGHKFLQDATPTEETHAMQDTLDLLAAQWADLKDTVSTHYTPHAMQDTLDL